MAMAMVTATAVGATAGITTATATACQVGGPSKTASRYVTDKEAVRKGGLSYICNSQLLIHN